LHRSIPLISIVRCHGNKVSWCPVLSKLVK